MTILGLIASADTATIWCDTLAIFEGKPASYIDKLTLNRAAMLMVAGTGATLILETLRAQAAAARSIEELLLALPDQLRRKVFSTAAFYGVPEEALSRKTTAIVAGWSFRQQRVRAWRLRGTADFEPENIAHHAAPEVDGLATFHLPTLEDLRGVAVEQVLALERRYGFKITGRVIVGTIRRNEVAAGVLLDLGVAGSIAPVEQPPVAALVEIP